MNKIRVAQLVGNAQLGGVSNCVLNYFRYVDRERFFFDFLTYGESAFDEKVRALGGETKVVNDFRNPIKGCSDLKRILKNNEYDIFHCHLTSLSVFPLFVANREKIGVKIVHAHSATDEKDRHAFYKNVLKKYADRYADARFSCSDLSGTWLYGNGEYFLMPNAVDLDRFSFSQDVRKRVRDEYGVEGLCMGFAGRFEPQKNLFRFLDIAEIVQKKTDSVAVLLGDGSQKEELIRYARDRGIKAKFLDGTDRIEDWYCAFDALVMPSLFEGLPLVGVEAQACSLPVFFSEAVTRESDFGGATFFTDDLSAAEKILSVEGRIHCKDRLIERGYDIKTAAKRLENEYEKLLWK